MIFDHLSRKFPAAKCKYRFDIYWVFFITNCHYFSGKQDLLLIQILIQIFYMIFVFLMFSVIKSFKRFLIKTVIYPKKTSSIKKTSIESCSTRLNYSLGKKTSNCSDETAIWSKHISNGASRNAVYKLKTYILSLKF